MAMSSVAMAESSSASSSKDVNEMFTRYEMIGEGAYGAVYRGIYNDTGTPVALKVFDLENAYEDISEIQREVALLSHLKDARRHNITLYHGSFLKEHELWIAMDFASGGSIRTLMKSGKINEKQIALIVRETLVALSFLHRQGIIHRDVKAANILMTQHGRILLCDLGVAAHLVLSNKRSTFVGTPLWMAPEVITEGKEYDEKADIWSLGVTIYEMATGNPPMAGEDPFQVFKLITENSDKQHPSFLDDDDFSEFSEEMVSFMKLCLEIDPQKRPSAEELMRHRWIRSVLRNPLTPLKELVDQYLAWTRNGGKRMSLVQPEVFVREDTFDIQEDDGGWDFDIDESQVSQDSSTDDSLNTQRALQIPPASFNNELPTPTAEHPNPLSFEKTLLPGERNFSNGVNSTMRMGPTSPVTQRQQQNAPSPQRRNPTRAAETLASLFSISPKNENSLDQIDLDASQSFSDAGNNSVIDLSAVSNESAFKNSSFFSDSDFSLEMLINAERNNSSPQTSFSVPSSSDAYPDLNLFQMPRTGLPSAPVSSSSMSQPESASGIVLPPLSPSQSSKAFRDGSHFVHGPRKMGSGSGTFGSASGTLGSGSITSGSGSGTFGFGSSAYGSNVASSAPSSASGFFSAHSNSSEIEHAMGGIGSGFLADPWAEEDEPVVPANPSAGLPQPSSRRSYHSNKTSKSSSGSSESSLREQGHTKTGSRPSSASIDNYLSGIDAGPLTIDGEEDIPAYRHVQFVSPTMSRVASSPTASSSAQPQNPISPVSSSRAASPKHRMRQGSIDTTFAFPKTQSSPVSARPSTADSSSVFAFPPEQPMSKHRSHRKNNQSGSSSATSSKGSRADFTFIGPRPMSASQNADSNPMPDLKLLRSISATNESLPRHVPESVPMEATHSSPERHFSDAYSAVDMKPSSSSSSLSHFGPSSTPTKLPLSSPRLLNPPRRNLAARLAPTSATPPSEPVSSPRIYRSRANTAPGMLLPRHLPSILTRSRMDVLEESPRIPQAADTTASEDARKPSTRSQSYSPVSSTSNVSSAAWPSLPSLNPTPDVALRPYNFASLLEPESLKQETSNVLADLTRCLFDLQLQLRQLDTSL